MRSGSLLDRGALRKERGSFLQVQVNVTVRPPLSLHIPRVVPVRFCPSPSLCPALPRRRHRPHRAALTRPGSPSIASAGHGGRQEQAPVQGQEGKGKEDVRSRRLHARHWPGSLRRDLMARGVRHLFLTLGCTLPSLAASIPSPRRSGMTSRRPATSPCVRAARHLSLAPPARVRAPPAPHLPRSNTPLLRTRRRA